MDVKKAGKGTRSASLVFIARHVRFSTPAILTCMFYGGL